MNFLQIKIIVARTYLSRTVYIIKFRRGADLYEDLLVFVKTKVFLQYSEDSILILNQIRGIQFNSIIHSTSISSKYFVLIMFQY
jgi:hypothetical protein